MKYIAIPIIFILLGCGANKNPKDEPLYQEQWALHYNKPFYDAYNINKDAHIHGQKALNSFTGKGIKIAIIDMGISYKHPEYTHAIKKVINSKDGSSKVICNNFTTCYHGTAVTGIISSAINGKGLRGIAPNAEITFIHLDLTGYVSDGEILDALIYAEEEHIDIINASWGTGNISTVVKAKIDDMATNGRDGKGIIFIFAVGNTGKESIRDESMIESVIAVGSTDEENIRGIYSNFGKGLDIMAPGGFTLGITSTYPIEDFRHLNPYMKAEDYKKFQGTSASAPIISASIALLLEKNPQLTRIEIQNLIYTYSDKIGNITYINKRNNYYGYGKLNLDMLLYN